MPRCPTYSFAEHLRTQRPAVSHNLRQNAASRHDATAPDTAQDSFSRMCDVSMAAPATSPWRDAGRRLSLRTPQAPGAQPVAQSTQPWDDRLSPW